MALIVLPIGLLIGLLLADARRARVLTLVIGVCALAVLGIAALRGVEVSPLETLVLLVCLPIAMWLAGLGARWRRRGRQGG